MSRRICLAGRIAAVVGDHHVDERGLSGSQARLLLALLVCERQRPIDREELADNLWPEGRPATWPTALRGVVRRVRGFLETAGFGGPEVVRGEAGTYRVELPEDLEVDLESAVSDSARAVAALEEGDAAAAQGYAEQARAVLEQPLLPGVEAPWLDEKRRELSAQRLQALETLASARLATGAVEAARDAAERAVAWDPFRESAHRLLLRAHYQRGDAAAGLHAFESLRRMLADELGTDPSPATRALHDDLLRLGDSAADPVPPPPPAPAAAAPARSDPPGGVPRPSGTPAPDLAPSADLNGCPYRGLQPFTEDDAALFFGRSADVARLLARLSGKRFLAVVGPSGSGKSSLLRAGLVPALRRGSLPGSDTWAVTSLRPAAGADAAEETVTRARALAGPSVLLVDQLEEAFSLCDAHERQRLFDAITAAVTRANGGTTVVVGVRADAYQRLATHPLLADLASADQFLVSPMDEVGLAEAIEGPARAVGLDVEAGLTETMVAAIAGRPGALPLLSHCLFELWSRRRDGVLSLAAYREVGGIDGAVAHRAEAIYADLSPAQREVARRVLLRLVEPSETGEHGRRRVDLRELPGTTDAPATVSGLVDELVSARLLATGGAPGESQWVEVTHEALLRGWPRLAGWIEEDRAGLWVHRRLTAAAEEWDRFGRDDEALYRGAPLAEAAAWAEDRSDELNPHEQAFLDASLAAQDGERRRRVRRLRLTAATLAVVLLALAGLAGAALLARDAAEEQRRLAESRQLAADATAELALDPERGLERAVAATQRAPTEEAVAALRQALITPRPRVSLPHSGGDIAVDPSDGRVALDTPEGVVEVRDLGTGELVHQLTRSTEGPLLEARFNPDGDRLLAGGQGGVDIWDLASGTHAHRVPTGERVLGAVWLPEGERVVIARALDEAVEVWDSVAGERQARITTPGPVQLLDVAADGELLLAWSSVDPEVYVIELASGETVAVLDGHEAPAVDARIGPDGQRAVTVGLDDTARLWELPGGEAVTTIDGFDDGVWLGQFDPAGDHVVVGDGVGTVRALDVTNGTTVLDQRAHTDTVVDTSVTPDGEAAVTTSPDGTARVWDLETGRERAVLQLDGGADRSTGYDTVAVTDDGGTIVTSAGSVEVWDTPPGPERRLAGHDGQVTALEVGPDAARVASGGFDGTVRVWDLETGRDRFTAEVPGSLIRTVSFSPDGTQLATAAPSQAATAQDAWPPVLWDLDEGGRSGTLDTPAPRAPTCPNVCLTTRALYSPDGTKVLTAGQEGVPRVWDAETGSLARELEPAGEQIRDVVWSPDGEVIAAATQRRVLRWQVGSGEHAGALQGAAAAVAFDPAGQLVAAAGDDGAVRVWDPAEGEVTAELRHASTVADVAWSPDGRFLLAAAGDGAHLWDVDAEQRIRALPGEGAVGRVAFADADTLVLGATDGAVSVHRCLVCGSVDDLLETAHAELASTSEEQAPAE